MRVSLRRGAGLTRRGDAAEAREADASGKRAFFSLINKPIQSADALLEHRIDLSTYREGQHYAICPQCSHTRSRRHQKLKCLSVRIDGDGACWKCHHCGWSGGARQGHSDKRDDRRRAERDQGEKTQTARWLWRQSIAARGTIAEIYLRSRSITVPIPTTIRFLHPHKPGHHPAMIAPFGIPGEPEPGMLGMIPAEKITGIHLTFLKADGSAKADIDPDKIIVGPSIGLPIALASANDLLGLAIAEGIEDALTLHQVSGLGALAAGCASRLPALADTVPDFIDCITIPVDDDSDGEKYSAELAARLRARGFEVRMLRARR